MREITCHTAEAVEKQPTINLGDLSVIKTIAQSGNRKLSKGVVISEMMDMMFLRRHNTTLSSVSEQVRHNNARIIQKEGTDVWGLTETRRNVDVDTEQYGDSDASEQVNAWIPPHIVDCVEEVYGPRKWREAISAAVGCYMSQSFNSLHQVMAVQIDVISETYETTIGAWIDENADEWVVSMNTANPEDWGDGYQNNVGGNTPRDIRIDWIQEAFENILPQAYVSESKVEKILNQFFDISGGEAKSKATDPEIDYDQINAEWYDSVIDNVDSDVRERVDNPTELAALSGDNVEQLSIIDDAPENMVMDDGKNHVTAKATHNLTFKADWDDLTWETRLGVTAGDVDDPELRHDNGDSQ
ncbi:hypothetical protein ABNG02_00895 [Halorubrum ejinorense]|uniref:Uncharacterized protein n=1 Tax=Halorubrum ejinorense TaxID=425309 RepID=A0AAV3SP39_9EURY